MKLYFASLYHSRKEIWKHEIPERILLSFHYEREILKTLYWIKQEGLLNRIEVILDSGAFSSWNKGIVIDRSRYADFILMCLKEFKELKGFYVVNLDVIPGKQGERITKELSEKSMYEGWENYLYFKGKGIETVHVYHEGESEAFLMDTIIKECSYIGVSPCNDSSTNQKILWLDRIFHLLPHEVKTHGFAVTSLRLMKKYPWYSVDSASWCRKSGFGNVLTSYGELVFSTKGRKCFLDGQGSELSKISVKKLHEEFESYGIYIAEDKLVEELYNNLKLRNLINYKFLKWQETKINALGTSKKFINPQLSFF